MQFWKSFFDYKDSTNIGSHDSTSNQALIVDNTDGAIYLSKYKSINLDDLESLCDSVGWVRRPIKKVKLALENSFLIVSIFHCDSGRQSLIGFARVTSDGSFNATIWDVVVHPNFQGRGLGKILMIEIIKELRIKDISTITLFADPEVIQFYKHIGFIIDPDGVKGMFWYPI
uniref:N-acetyltransferase domain-containing protein n=1 Tax=Polysiphonia sertularioides TaxID=945028 RepID=A0A1Z1MFQ3_9FLOR|nr:hypothetical protein [Polysiphonia sertularioides]